MLCRAKDEHIASLLLDLNFERGDTSCCAPASIVYEAGDL